MEREEQRDTERFSEITFRVLQSPLSEDWLEEEESREFLDSSMKRPEVSSSLSWRMSFVTLLPTLNTPEERPSLRLMSSMLSRDKEELFTDSEVKSRCYKYLSVQ